MKKFKKFFLFTAVTAAAGSLYYLAKNGKLDLPWADAEDEAADLDDDFEDDLRDLFDDFNEGEATVITPATEEEEAPAEEETKEAPAEETPEAPAEEAEEAPAEETPVAEETETAE